MTLEKLHLYAADLERLAAPADLPRLVLYVHQACLNEFSRVAGPLGVQLEGLTIADAARKTYFSFEGLEGLLVAYGPRRVALEWLQVFGWLVTDAAMAHFSGEGQEPPDRLRAIDQATRGWHPELMRGCCPGGAN